MAFVQKEGKTHAFLYDIQFNFHEFKVQFATKCHLIGDIYEITILRPLSFAFQDAFSSISASLAWHQTEQPRNSILSRNFHKNYNGKYSFIVTKIISQEVGWSSAFVTYLPN